MKEIAYLISHYIEAFIIFQYCHCIFKQKKSNSSVFLGFTLCYSFLFGIFHFQNIYVNIIASILAPLFLISYLYDVPKIYAFFHSLVLYLSMALGELAGASLLSLLSDHYWNTWSTDIHLLFLSTILCKTLYLCIVFILICFQKAYNHSHFSRSRFFFSSCYNFLFYVCQHPVIYFWLTVSRKFLKQLHNFYYNSVAPRHIISGLCTLQLQQ